MWKIHTIMAEQESVGMALCINGTAKVLINGNLFSGPSELGRLLYHKPVECGKETWQHEDNQQ